MSDLRVRTHLVDIALISMVAPLLPHPWNAECLHVNVANSMLPFELAVTERIPSGGPTRCHSQLLNQQTRHPPATFVETVNRFEHSAPVAQPQHACIVRSNVDGVSNSHTAESSNRS